MKQKIEDILIWSETNRGYARMMHIVLYCITLFFMWLIIISLTPNNKSLGGFLCFISFFAANYILNAIVYLLKCLLLYDYEISDMPQKVFGDFLWLWNKLTQYRPVLYNPEAKTEHIRRPQYQAPKPKTADDLLRDVDAMNGHAFESWSAELLRKSGFNDVYVTKGSGDQGIDVVGYKDEIKYGIQCKCYSSDLGNTPVQEAYAGKSMYDCHVAVVMTNRHFTTGAKELAHKTGVLLWDRDKLRQMVDIAYVRR